MKKHITKHNIDSIQEINLSTKLYVYKNNLPYAIDFSIKILPKAKKKDTLKLETVIYPSLVNGEFRIEVDKLIRKYAKELRDSMLIYNEFIEDKTLEELKEFDGEVDS